jgi:hypothetical protein
VRTDRKTVINGEDDLFIGKNRIINIAINLNHNVGGTMDETVTKDVSCTYNGSYSTAVKDELVFYCQSTIDIACVDKMNIGTNDTFDLYSTGAMKIETANTYTNIVASTAVHTVGSTYTITAGGTYKVTAPMILLN